MGHRRDGVDRSRRWRRITIPLPPDLSDRIDAAVNGQPAETMTSLVRRAIDLEIDRLERERGTEGPFPPAGRPRPGRPRKIGVNGRTPSGRAHAAAEPSAEVERLLHVLERADAASSRDNGVDIRRLAPDG